jgi:hypothetical protein
MQVGVPKPIQIQGVKIPFGVVLTPRSGAKLSTEATLCRLAGMVCTG